MTPDPKIQKQENLPSRWETWVAKLSPTALQALSPSATEPAARPREEARCEFQAWTESALTPQTAAAISSLSQPQADVPEEADYEQEYLHAGYKFCLVESPEGDYPRLRMFNDPATLARRLASLEGQEVAVWPFFGLPMGFTKGSPRYLMLPDGTAMTIPISDSQSPEIVQRLFDDTDMQEDGFLGPPELVGEVRDDDS